MSAPLAFPELIGDVVGESYKIVEQISAGAHGVVFRAIDLDAPSSSQGHDRSSDRAIKVVPRDGPVLGALEIGLHSLVSAHPNVITMDVAFEDDDFFYLVLDLCPGGDLSAKIFDERVFDHNDELVRAAFLQILDAVEACHAASVYHRDLKPENILCNEDGSEVYLCDFGSGRGRPIGREFGSGTLNYMSPECLGEDIGCRPYSNVRHDIWALGVILFNMITAAHPWAKASTADDQFSDYLHDNDILLENTTISVGANDILRKIFVLNPMGRITIPELRAAIVGLDSFFSQRNPANGDLDKSEDIDAISFSVCLPEEHEQEEELCVDPDEEYIFPSTDLFCAPTRPIKQLLELDYREVDAIVRIFCGELVEEPTICSPSPLLSHITSDESDRSEYLEGKFDICEDSDSDEADDDNDDDGPITPDAIEGAAGVEINVYDGMFLQEVKGRLLFAAKASEASGKSRLPSPPALDLFSGIENERVLGVTS
ncbi:hypothetical protein ACG7TL_001429 [Trametes sanguinea]